MKHTRSAPRALVHLLGALASVWLASESRAALDEYQVTLTEEGVFAPNPGTQHVGGFVIDADVLVGGPAVISSPAWSFSITIDGQAFATTDPPFFVKTDAENRVIIIGAQIDDALGTTQLLFNGSFSDPEAPWSLVGAGSNEGFAVVTFVPGPAHGWAAAAVGLLALKRIHARRPVRSSQRFACREFKRRFWNHVR